RPRLRLRYGRVAITRKLETCATDRCARTFRSLIGNRSHDLVWPIGRCPKRTLPGEQFVKDDAETVNVARCCHAFASYLFRAGIFGRHDTLQGESHAAALCVSGVD